MSETTKDETCKCPERSARIKNGTTLSCKYCRATPTPLEQGEVRDALGTCMRRSDAEDLDILAKHFNVSVSQTADWGEACDVLADALLARVAPQGETSDLMACGCYEDGEFRYYCHTHATRRATQPAAKTGEPFSKRVIRNEPGVTEIHVEAREVLRDGPMRVECWWGEEDGAYLAQLTDAEKESRSFAATHTAHGDTREGALAHLAIGEYVTALALAAPAPREVSEAMVRAAYLEGYEDAESDPYNLSKERYAEGWEASNARAALSAETGTK